MICHVICLSLINIRQFALLTWSKSSPKERNTSRLMQDRDKFVRLSHSMFVRIFQTKKNIDWREEKQWFSLFNMDICLLEVVCFADRPDEILEFRLQVQCLFHEPKHFEPQLRRRVQHWFHLWLKFRSMEYSIYLKGTECSNDERFRISYYWPSHQLWARRLWT